MVQWYLEQTKPDSIVTGNINAVRKDAIISTITKMLEVNLKQYTSRSLEILNFYVFSPRIARMLPWMPLWVFVKICRL